jgi:hypothetical protein
LKCGQYAGLFLAFPQADDNPHDADKNLPDDQGDDDQFETKIARDVLVFCPAFYLVEVELSFQIERRLIELPRLGRTVKTVVRFCSASVAFSNSSSVMAARIVACGCARRPTLNGRDARRRPARGGYRAAASSASA